MKKLTTAEFVAKARSIHGDRYDYSKTEYVNNKTNLKIICAKHGEFLQNPRNHLKGGCFQCGVDVRAGNRTYTLDRFIDLSRQIHGDKYDYSQSKYIDSQIHVEILCPKHGSFWQAPNKHLFGQQCPKCSRGYKSWDEYLNIFRTKHGGKYDYSKANYINSNIKIEIICPEHGSFWQQPKNHERHGCPKCGQRQGCKKRTICSKNGSGIQYFIEKAKSIHGEKYDYSKVNYENSRVKVEIICPEHGTFLQTPHKHLLGQGCNQCGKAKLASIFSFKLSDFLIKANEVHGSDYSYADVNYTNMHTPVKIICPTHGSFHQRPQVHILGSGCPKCGRERTTTKQRLPLQDFIAKANSIHDSFYDYSQVEYNGTASKIDIICPQHGVFNQLAGNHLTGRGCPSCSGGPYSPIRATSLYLIKFKTPIAEFWKIGITRQGIEHRYRYDKRYIAKSFTFSFDSGLDAFNVEQSILKLFADHKMQYLFPLLKHGGDTECFNTTLPIKKVIKYITQKLQSPPGIASGGLSDGLS